MDAPFGYARYDWSGGAEWMMVHGPSDAPQALILSPLFEEHNFTRTIVVAMARNLAARGIGSWIADLPGVGESDWPLAEVHVDDWRGAAGAAGRVIQQRTGCVPHILSLRGGALIDDAVAGASWWRFAPAKGAPLIRILERAQAIGESAGGGTGPATQMIEIAGFRMDARLRDAVRGMTPATPAGPLREVAYDRPGVAPWRRAEPGRDDALAQWLADDAAQWIMQCAG